ncbi:acylphosphatase [Salisediminibacterium halotolerans]|uniref:acylphosphatase n=1 Tax=Salisediminibacterium halotolerans TaxID=517425 RepID=UPI000EADD96E|nr:acylphosphatase [Salisediminibacterium halotolerans]RLJ75599.1 D-alanine-D-alanine ligase-like ATP-grasp enzyme [Actinophytocola xinjiangensis]RPE89453.1 D-alanine-D-alanine ligase-like ATP-grasp enzyme [Salisediminibacterium halotolerans]TWG36212.1 D-alanine-D-alanine ligase-like ATP-grasp enzyme [Salisediminibacterium halotolerans]GEL08351.1 hypothetical protein SHA02_17670 [Salisediminibacterium halotolerans]
MSDNQNPHFLAHLPEEVVMDARGYEFDAYLVALEGWRRGLTLKWYTKDAAEFSGMNIWNVDHPGKLFSLSDGEKTHRFFRTRGDRVSEQAVKECMDKETAKTKLSANDVPTPAGERVKTDLTAEDLIVTAEKIGFPVVLKPVDGSFGRGVYTDLRDQDSLIRCWNEVREESATKEYLLESHVEGDEYRVYVVQGRTVGIMRRDPANVTGDGKQTIEQLIEEKNTLREANPRLFSCPIIINNDVKRHLDLQGHSLTSVPENDAMIQLTKKSNISLGGDPEGIEVEEMTAVATAAEGAMRAFEGLINGAVDVIWDEESGNLAVLEMNPTAQIGSLVFPMSGVAHDIPKAIIDEYFPETADCVIERERLYFDFADVLYPLKSHTARSSTVAHAYTGELTAKQYTVYGDVQEIDYHRGLRKQAFERGLSGFVMNLEDGAIEVVVIGSDETAVLDYEQALWEDPERSEVEYVEVTDYNGPIKIGFETKSDMKMQLQELDTLRIEIEQMEQEYKKESKLNQKLRNSWSWRVSYPIRLAGDVSKVFKRKK